MSSECTLPHSEKYSLSRLSVGNTLGADRFSKVLFTYRAFPHTMTFHTHISTYRDFPHILKVSALVYALYWKTDKGADF
jgi:hypothetical protein